MQKTEVSGMYKDRDGILINKDEEGLAAYKMRKQQFRRIDTMEVEINALRNDISEIKEMIRGLKK